MDIIEYIINNRPELMIDNMQLYNGIPAKDLWSTPSLTFAASAITWKQKWPEAEPYIMADPRSIYIYVRGAVHDRWIEAEPIIMKSPRWAYEYARNVIKDRWIEAEPYIMKSPEYTYEYARNVIKGRWIEAEPIIMKSPEYTYWYIEYIWCHDCRHACSESGREKPLIPDRVRKNWDEWTSSTMLCKKLW